MSKWKIEFDKKAQKELHKLDKKAQEKIIKFLEERVLKQDNPKAAGAPLHSNLSGLWRYRVGDYRIICKIENSTLLVLVVSIGHRKEIYKKH